MRIFRKRPDNGLNTVPTLLEDIERLWRRARAVPLIAPLLLFAGWGAGTVASDALVLPEDTEVRRSSIADVPRVHLEALTQRLLAVQSSGAQTADYVTVYRDQIEPVEMVLRKRGVSEETARRIAWPLVRYAGETKMPIETVMSVVFIESNAKPSATSFVGARGLMQIMPFWTGYYKECGRDLYDIDANLCAGTRILSYYYDRFGGDERRALLGYNGCVRGTNTPNCHTYPDKIARVRTQIERELRLARNRTGRAASP